MCALPMYIISHCAVVFDQYNFDVGGDQLTTARIRGCQKVMSNSDSDLGRLEGVTALIEDWHAKVAFLGVSIIIIYTQL